MSNLITPKATQERNLDKKDEWVLRVGEAFHHAAAVMRNAHAWFWSLPTDQLLELLNADIPVTLATFAQNTAIGQATNAALDAVNSPDLPNRAPVEVGRFDIVFDGTQFVYVPPQLELPPQPEPEPTE